MDASLGTNGTSGKFSTCPAESCFSILNDGYSVGNGNYWISNASGESVEVYCDMTIEDGGWMMFGVLDSGSENILDSQPIGSLSQGSIGNVGYSLDLDSLHNSVDSSFDVMIQFGDLDVYSETLLGLTKNGSSFFTMPTEVGDGMHGLLGNSSVDGIFATYCSGFGECLNYGHDFFNFSTSGELPESEFVTCGFTAGVEGRFAYWKNCPSGDNIQLMRSWIRY